MHACTVRLRWSVLVFSLVLVVGAVGAARAQEPSAQITLPDSAPARVQLTGPDRGWHTGYLKFWDDPRCPLVWVPELHLVPSLVPMDSLQVRFGEGADTTWLTVDMAAVLSDDPPCALFVEAARRAFFATIVRANLIMLAEAESTYYGAHLTFTNDLALLPQGEDGKPFHFTSAMAASVSLDEGGEWEATAQDTRDTSVVCFSRGFVREGIPHSASTQCPRLDAVPLRFEGGLSLNLPYGWTVRDSAGLSTWAHKLDSISANAGGQEREPIERSSGLLLVAHGPDRTTLTLRVDDAPGMSPQAFDVVTPEQREQYRSLLCESVQKSDLQARCGQLKADSIRDRPALIFQFESEDSDRWIRAWSVQVATTEAIVSLSFLAGIDEAEDYEPTFRRVWRSLSVPERLGTEKPKKPKER